MRTLLALLVTTVLLAQNAMLSGLVKDAGQ